jgi:hypothetical protein
LGEYLDANHARTFSVYWTPSLVVVDYKKIGGFSERLRFAPTSLAESIGGGIRRALRQN